MSAEASASPKVSVVMGVFNDVARLETSVASILDQSFDDLEFIVVNDGSTDGSGALLDRLADSDPRLRVVHQRNAGLTRALILGCEQARGELIARQDSDDWSHPARIAEQVALLASDERIGFVSCATQYVGPADEPLVVVSRPMDPDRATREMLLEGQGPPAHGSVIFRRALYRQVGGYRAAFYYSQDSDLWLRLAERALIAYVPSVRYMHRRDIGSTSGAQRPRQRRFGELSQECGQARREGRSEAPFLELAEALSAEVRARKAQGDVNDAGAMAAATYLIGSQLARNGDRRAVGYLRRTLRARPLHWKAWVRLAQALLLGRRFVDENDT